MTANTFDFTVANSPATPATGTISGTAFTQNGVGIIMDSSGIRIGAVNSSGAYVESANAIGLASFVNGNFSARCFWLEFDGPSAALRLYVADWSPSSITAPPQKPASAQCTLTSISTTVIPGMSYMGMNIGTGATGTNQNSFGVTNLWLIY